jgi:lysophospholipase L1-like esterase
MELPLRKKIAFAAIAIVGILFLLEGVARVLLPPPEGGTYAEHGRLIQVLGLPALNDILEFDPDLFWKLKPELRGHRVAGKIREAAVDFKVTTHGGYRSIAPIETKRRFRVLALGDSCTFGLGVQDGETWPAQLEGVLQVSGLDVEVINAGVPGYSAYQGRRLFETRGLALEPDLVLVTFGFNDADTGMPRSDFETAEALKNRTAVPFLSGSRLAEALRGLVVRPQPAGPKRPRLSPAEMLETLDGIKRLCDMRGIAMIVVIWPYEGQVRQNAPDYVLHQQTLARFCQERGVEGVDLINAFVRAGGPLFLDHIHADARGCRVTAESLAPWVSDHAGRFRRL